MPEKPKVRKKVKKKAKKPKAKTSDINMNQDSDVGERETTKSPEPIVKREDEIKVPSEDEKEDSI